MVSLLAVLQWATSLALTVQFAMLSRKIDKVPATLKKGVTVYFVSTSVCDITITIAMIIILSSYKAKTTFVGTTSLLNTLIATTIENGLITTLTAVVNLILYFTRPHDLIGVAIQYVIGGLYAIVLVTTLNRRQNGRRTDGTSFSLSDAGGFNSTSARNNTSVRGPAGSYQVNVLGSMGSMHVGKTEEGLRRAGDPILGDRSVMVSVSKEMHEDLPYATAKQ
ncbi:hypothetical protein DFP72DRAFT_64667 [Ephemerocybe angulata]|uniref:DUF6534 domain-containing protein n=1 Tax=Ephemerocybe angulata TaxID=980116 RepID=A0A8H6LXY7_9AGAR|nr:hypothetical protein DFP72DRAFT_64667 [Tulosesus angulatus]